MLWDVSTGTAAQVLRHPQGISVQDVAFSPSGSQLATTIVARDGRTLFIWDLRDSKSTGSPAAR